MKKIVAILLNVVLFTSLFGFSGKNASDSEYRAFDAVSENYLEEWSSVTDQQKIFLALTHNLFGSNGMNYTQLFPREEGKRTDSYEKSCASILKGSWSVVSAKEIPEVLTRLDYNSTNSESSDFACTYDKMVLALKNNIDNIDVYSVKSGFTPYERQILYFASFYGKYFDENGVIGYDLGRKLNILRWALGCGYLNWEETWAYAEPVVQEILTRFDSWIDFTRSYIGGRFCFSMTQARTSEDYFYTSIKSSEVFYHRLGKEIPQGFFRVNEYKEEPFKDMWNWEEAYTNEYQAFDVLYAAYYRENKDVIKLFGEELLSNMITYSRTVFPEDPFYALYAAKNLVKETKSGDTEKLNETYEILEEAFLYSELLPHDHWLYEDYKIFHYVICTYTDHFEQVVSMYESFPCIKAAKMDQYDFEYAYAIYALIEGTEPNEEKIRMKKTALAILDRLALTNDINDSLLDSLRSYGETVEIPEDAEDIFNLAIDYYNNKQYQFAFTLLMEAAEKGHARACNELGACYINGIGTQQNYELAFRYYSMAAERGFALGAYNVGICYQLGEYVNKDLVLAARWVTKAALEECPVAMYTLADYYRRGTGVLKDEKKAVQWMEKACQYNFPGAYSDLGSYYATGVGCEVDLEKAVEYFKTGVELGNMQCMRKLGICYLNGNGVEADTSQAAWYFNLAAKEGDETSMYFLGKIYENSIGLEGRLKTAFYWYEKAADNNDGEALIRMGDAYYGGEYFYEQDFEKAASYYYTAYQMGYGPAWVSLARLFHFGHGVEKNDKTAWELLSAAVKYEVSGAAEMMKNFGWSVDVPIE